MTRKSGEGTKRRRRRQLRLLQWRLRFGPGNPVDIITGLSGLVLRNDGEYAAAATASLNRAVRRHRDPLAREWAGQALGYLGESSATPALVSATGDAVPRVRAAALTALARLSAHSFTWSFHLALDDSYEGVQEAAVRGLAQAGQPRYGKDLARFLEHHVMSVRRSAATGLREWGWATTDPDRARVAMAGEAWTDVAALDAGSVAEVVRLISLDDYWNWGNEHGRERKAAFGALEELVERHVGRLDESVLRAAAELRPFHYPVVDMSYDESQVHYPWLDVSRLRALCAAELERRRV